MTTFRRLLQLSSIFCYLIAFVSAWRPCSEISQSLRTPCRCEIVPFGISEQKNSIKMDCDRVVFTSETQQIPIGAPITHFSQRNAGQQALPTQVIWYAYCKIEHENFIVFTASGSEAFASWEIVSVIQVRINQKTLIS